MAQLVVRNIDDEALDGVRTRARRHARSLEAEIRLLIEAAGRRERDAAAFWARADAIREAGPGFDPSNSADLRKIGRRGE
jgi:plasmid stability protein